LQDGLQLLQDSRDVEYVAYFRHLPRSMCGKTPKVRWWVEWRHFTHCISCERCT
jgi:hypothetical protein